MPVLNRESLKTLREKKKSELFPAEPENVRITVGMGTCGIAAGSKSTYSVFEKVLSDLDLTDINLKESGCMGLCYAEPTVEVAVPGMPTVIYGNVDEETAKQIVTDHVSRKLLLNDHIYDRPALDIVKDVRK